MFSKNSIISKTIQVASSTLASRMLGTVREVLMARFLGASALSDAFLTAFKVPNSLRKFFAEGALSAAFVPTIVQAVREKGRRGIKHLMVLGFLIFESMVLILCALVMYFAPFFVRLIAPGFSGEQSLLAAQFLTVLMPFIFFVSTSALLSGALHAIGHFFIPSIGPVLLNLFFISGILFCIKFKLSVIPLCWFILAGGCAQLILHVIAYLKLGFRFGSPRRQDVKIFLPVLGKFFMCLLSMSIVEVSLIIDTTFASYLSEGSVSLLYYANRFMGIPLGVFGVAFSTILLPHFSRVSVYAPKRLGFYLLEAAKLIWWVMFPVSLLLGFFSHQIFLTLFYSEKFTLDHVGDASHILIAFLFGLFFFALNKVLLNIYYAQHHTLIPGLISAAATAINVLLNMLLMNYFGAKGLALATSVAGIVQTTFLILVLVKNFKFKFYLGPLCFFIVRNVCQVLVFFVPLILLYSTGTVVIKLLAPAFSHFLLNTIGFWLWVGPLCGAYMLVLWFTRHIFGLRMYFLD